MAGRRAGGNGDGDGDGEVCSDDPGGPRGHTVGGFGWIVYPIRESLLGEERARFPRNSPPPTTTTTRRRL
jgi:hypothetical protein